jgi:predicted molibdopterin-dependent oxidoreductase YjgC
MDMITLTIDGKEVTVKRGSTILEAAEQAGIEIPILCHDKRLIPYGSCRICVVEQKGREGRFMPACFFPVRQGMEILTNTPGVIETRKANLELLLVKHPLECPVCDAAGNCELQKLTYEYEVFENPYRLKPEEGERDLWKEKPYIGTMAVSQLDRCILCGKCVRMCNELVGLGEIQLLGRGVESSMGTDFNRPLDCEFCGQCVDTCPVGAIVLKLNSREWELDRTPSVCGYCGLGCALLIGTKGDKVKVIFSDDGIGANERNLCSKGRFGWGYIYNDERLKAPLIRQNGKLVPCSWEEAFGAVAKGLGDIKEKEGPDKIGGIGSTRLTNEEAYLFQKFMRAVIGTNNVDNSGAYSNDGLLRGLKESLGYAASTNSIREIRDCDAILVFRSDLRDSHPVAKIEVILTTGRNRAKLVVANPMMTELNKKATVSLIYKPQTELTLINGFIHVIIREGLVDESFCSSRVEGLEALKESVSRFTPEYCEKVTGIPNELIIEGARIYGKGKKAVILVSTGLAYRGDDTSLAKGMANLALLTGNLGKKNSGIFLFGEKCNTQGTLDMGLHPAYLPGYQEVNNQEARQPFEEAWGGAIPESTGWSSIEMLDAAEKGDLKALYLVGTDPITSYPDSHQSLNALKSLEFLVVQDLFLTEAANMAHVVLPASSFAEKEGTYTSSERRIQSLNRAIPNYGDTKSDLEILSTLSSEMGRKLNEPSWEEVLKEASSLIPFYRGIKNGAIGPHGIQWPFVDVGSGGTPFLYEESFPNGKARLLPIEAPEPAKTNGEYSFNLLTGTMLLHSGTLSTKATGMLELCPDSFCEINPFDAEKLNLEDGSTVQVVSKKGAIGVNIRISERAPEGIIYIPYNFGNVRVNELTQRDQVATFVRLEKA